MIKNKLIKINIIRLGCDKNDIDADIMAGLLKNEHFEIVSEAESADMIIVNTCGFIKSAKQESIDYILNAVNIKKNGGCRKIIVAGCLAQRYAEELATEITGVDAFVGVGDIDKIVSIVKEISFINHTKLYCSDPQISQRFSVRKISEGDISAYVKIAEGCDSFCSYCIIPMLRGRYQSRPIQSIVNEVRKLAAQGIIEINLVAQNTTAYGLDFAEEPQLVALLKELLKITKIRWYRLLYCYQDNITDDLLDLIANEDRIASYLDIPIQHSHPKILKAMNRKAIDRVSVPWFKNLQERIPDLTLRTTVMVGFPGEGEAEFCHLVDFINRVGFNHLGVFCYSAEEGTEAYAMSDQIDAQVSLARSNIIKDEQLFLALNKKRELINKQLPILLIEQKDGIWVGRGKGDAPDIDSICYVTGVRNATRGDVILVEIVEVDFDHIKGRMLKIEKRT